MSQIPENTIPDSVYEGKTAVITGGGEGIGLSIAKALGMQRMNIVIADIDKQNLINAQSTLDNMGVNAITVELDVAQQASWQEVAQFAQTHFGKIHMLVNNAGIAGETGAIEAQKAEGWQWTLDVNLLSILYGTQTLLPLIKSHDEGGWLVNVASMAGLGGIPFGGAYTASKMAVVGLTESWKKELHKSGIHAAVLCPGFVSTRIYDSERYGVNSDDPQKSNPKRGNNQFRGKEFVQKGIPSDIVGERLVEALNAKEFYIFTHPGFREIIKQRATAIDEAFARAETSSLLQNINQEIPHSF